jgi:hypothetical protein
MQLRDAVNDQANPTQARRTMTPAVLSGLAMNSVVLIIEMRTELSGNGKNRKASSPTPAYRIHRRGIAAVCRPKSQRSHLEAPGRTSGKAEGAAGRCAQHPSCTEAPPVHPDQPEC